ncbi:MAG TPA: Gfo/Idh/MocA family oxidoreductase [Sedimentisphaerales bacterium]|nr:Gfo/Idh/MocA family oxidoreductase [Sedimentisphaerales bacterium]
MEKGTTDANRKQGRQFSRRDFVKVSAAAASLSALASCRTLEKTSVFAPGTDRLRVGLIGCGGRGTGAANNCAAAAEGVEIAAMADLFQDRLDSSRKQLEGLGKKCTVTDRSCFVGFDAYKGVIASNVDTVILATPPVFRPIHLKAAIEAGKHVFMEKPVAVDPAGVRSVIASSDLARSKGLGIVAGTQRRHQAPYLEVMKRIHNGDIGEIVAAQCYWNGGAMLNWGPRDNPEWNELERQCRRWYFYCWICGDHIVEQHVHNLDIINWAIGSHPVQCLGMGGREVRTGPEYGNIFDHFAVEYEYPGGVRVMSMSSQINGTTERVGERVVGTKGSTYTTRSLGYIEGQNPYKYDGPRVGGMVEEHADLIKSIRDARPINEGQHVAESTLTAIMGRISAYTGRALKWDWVMNASALDLRPAEYKMGDLAVRPVPVPGKTQLI